jgi:hypothetical protein
MIEWCSGAEIIIYGETVTLQSSDIEVVKLERDRYQVFFNGDIINRVIIKLDKNECQQLQEKLKEVMKE